MVYFTAVRLVSIKTFPRYNPAKNIHDKEQL